MPKWQPMPVKGSLNSVCIDWISALLSYISISVSSLVIIKYYLFLFISATDNWITIWILLVQGLISAHCLLISCVCVLLALCCCILHLGCLVSQYLASLIMSGFYPLLKRICILHLYCCVLCCTAYSLLSYACLVCVYHESFVFLFWELFHYCFGKFLEIIFIGTKLTSLPGSTLFLIFALSLCVASYYFCYNAWPHTNKIQRLYIYYICNFVYFILLSSARFLHCNVVFLVWICFSVLWICLFGNASAYVLKVVVFAQLLQVFPYSLSQLVKASTVSAFSYILSCQLCTVFIYVCIFRSL